MEEDGGSPPSEFRQSQSFASTMGGDKEGVRVALRVRPLNRTEEHNANDRDEAATCIHCPEHSGDEVEVCMCDLTRPV